MYATMVNHLLPAGIKGLVVAELLAALMSSLSSVFNSSYTVETRGERSLFRLENFTLFWQKVYPTPVRFPPRIDDIQIKICLPDRSHQDFALPQIL
jgi:hypothetical protein